MLEEYIKKEIKKYLEEVHLGDTKIEIWLKTDDPSGINRIYITLNNRGVKDEFSYRIWNILFGSGPRIDLRDVANCFEEKVKMYAMKEFLRKEVEES